MRWLVITKKEEGVPFVLLFIASFILFVNAESQFIMGMASVLMIMSGIKAVDKFVGCEKSSDVLDDEDDL